MRNLIFQGDALSVLKILPDNYIQACISSPPYFNLRSYLPDNHPDKQLEIGLEETPEEYINKLVAVFREVRRVLRPDGICWLNIGDTYAGGGRGAGGKQEYTGESMGPSASVPTGYKAKDLMLIPARVALALQADGWWVRSECIWNKTNCLPESVEDRPTKAHEYVFLLSKNGSYYYDAEAIKEPARDWGTRDRSTGKYTSGIVPIVGGKHHGLTDSNRATTGRNKRSVWDIPTVAFPQAHFAVMPAKLVETCLLAGTSSQACEHCGSPWKRVIEHTAMIVRNGPKAGGYGSRTTDSLSGTMLAPAETRTVGWEPTCTCKKSGSDKCIVLDPFMGAGTVALVAIQHGRDYIGIELNESYITLIEKRIAQVQQHLWTGISDMEVPA